MTFWDIFVLMSFAFPSEESCENGGGESRGKETKTKEVLIRIPGKMPQSG